MKNHLLVIDLYGYLLLTVSTDATSTTYVTTVCYHCDHQEEVYAVRVACLQIIEFWYSREEKPYTYSPGNAIWICNVRARADTHNKVLLASLKYLYFT